MRLDKIGAQLSVSSDVGDLSVSLHVKKNDLPEALKLLGEILRSPSFPKDEFEILKRENLERLISAKTEPAALAGQALQRALLPYPKDNIRYVPTIEEGIARIEAVTLDDLKKVYEQISAEHGELAIVGDFDAEPVLTQIRGLVKDWKPSTPYERIDRSYTFTPKGTKETINTPDKANAVYIAGLITPLTDASPEYPALQVGNYLLGGAPLASRLSNRVRGEEGLSYGIGSRFSAESKDHYARFMVFAITNPKNMTKVDTAIKEEIDRFLKNGVSLAELSDGKKAFIEQQKVGRSNDANLTEQLAKGLELGRTYQYYADLEKKIDGLQIEDVQSTWKKVLDPSKMAIIHAGDFTKKSDKKDRPKK